MNASTVSLRPFLPEDVPILAAIFREAITELTAEDYSEAQREAWASKADDEAAFGERLAKRLTILALLDSEPAGFIALEGKTHIDMLFVRSDAAGMGIGRALLDAIEKLARARGAAELTVDASDTALLFFERRGYAPQRRNTVIVADEWLSNTTMRKTFGDAPKPDPTGRVLQ